MFCFERPVKHIENLLPTIIQGFNPPGDTSGGADGEPEGDVNENALGRHPEIQIQRERLTVRELEDTIAEESAKYEMQRNKIFKAKLGRRVQGLK